MTHSLSALLGSDLKAARTRAGLSQAAVAARADVAIGTIRGLETGIGTIPSFEVTRRALDLQFEGAPSETRLGDVLRGTRTKLGISVKRLCLAAKISKPTAIALERSRGNLSSANAAAAVLGNAPRLIPKLQPKISAILSSENLVVDDCVTFMRKLKKRKEMFDALITDPPYHLRLQAYGPNKGYMRTEWDGGNIAFSSSTWRAAHAVLRPGAFLVAFGAPRTFHRLVSAVEGAGFEIRDMMVWVCSTGLPKSLDVARSIEGLMAGNARYSGRRLPAKDGPAQPGPHMQRMAGTEWSGRTVELRHPEALKRAGLGTALKPGHEPILIARKPISEANVARNVLQHGTGAINIDAGRHGSKRRWPANLVHDGLEERWAPYFYSAKSNASDRGKGNHHPAAKPTLLMRHLVSMFSPEGGRILDPFRSCP